MTMKRWLGRRYQLLGPHMGVLLLLALNYAWRRFLEESDVRLYDYLAKYYFKPELVQHMSLVDWLLPSREFGGLWVPTTSGLTYLIQRVMTPAESWYLFNGLVLVVAYCTSWFVFRSLVFSYTLAFCLGFGTQFYHVYAIPGIISLQLEIAYYLLLLFSIYNVIVCTKHLQLWVTSFLFSLFLVVLGHEGWLAFLLFVWVAGTNVWLFFRRTKDPEKLDRTQFILFVMTVIGVLYIYIKSFVAFRAVGIGSEEDMVTNYPFAMLAVEDVISNLFLYFYMGITNFFPPFFLYSDSLATVGSERLIDLQAGYHSSASYLVPMSATFYWRYWAGAAAAVFAYALVKVVKVAHSTYSVDALVCSTFMLMAATPPVQVLIKFRPYNSMPFLTYKTVVGILGCALLISFLLTKVGKWYGERWAKPCITGCWLWLIIAVITRPTYLQQMATMTQTNYGAGYPDPLGPLIRLLGKYFQH